MRRGTKKTEVGVALSGHKVGRVRTKSLNKYTLDDRLMGGFGKNVPQDIQDVVDMDDALHVQRQDDPYFLLSLRSPTARAKELERFTDLTVITRSIQNARSDVLAIKKEIRDGKSAIRAARKDIEELSRYTSLKHDILLVSHMRDSLKVLERRYRRLIAIRDILLALKSKENAIERKATLDLFPVEKLCTQLEIVEKKSKTLRQCKERLDEVKGVQDIERVVPTQEMDSLQKSVAQLKVVEGTLSALKIHKENLRYVYKKEREFVLEIKHCEKALSALGLCPTCRKPFHEVKTSSLILGSSGYSPDEQEADIPF